MLDATAIHLWLIDAEDPSVRATCDLGWLNQSETGCMRACPGVRECTRYAVGRCLVRRLVGDAIGRPPARVALDESLSGAAARVPGGGRVVWDQGERWMAMALTGDNPIGVEVAPATLSGSLRPLRNAVVSPSEARWLERLPRRERSRGLARIRALKLAWLRASGAGSETDLTAVGILDADGGCPGIVSGTAGDWFVAEPITPPDGMRVAIAGRMPNVGRQPTIRHRPFTAVGGDLTAHTAAPGRQRLDSPVMP